MTNITVFKFGGSLIETHQDFLEIAKVIQKKQPSVVVISATKGSTNLLEQIALASHQGNIEKKDDLIRSYLERHQMILENLELSDKLAESFAALKNELMSAAKAPGDHLHTSWFDQILSIGERTSSLILCELLDEYELLFAPDYIRTNDHVGAADVDEHATSLAMQKVFQLATKGKKFVTQGFLGANGRNEIRTLGREGSDYSATLFAGALEAKEVVIYTDVAGVFESDPKQWPFVKVIDCLSYQQAEHMAQNGAKVLFPKTLEPLVEKKIPLVVTNLAEESSTMIQEQASNPPVFVYRDGELVFYSKKELYQKELQEVFGGLFSQWDPSSSPWHRLSLSDRPQVEVMQRFFQLI